MEEGIEKGIAEGRKYLMKEIKAEADKAKVRLKENGVEIAVPQSWGAAREKQIRLNERAIVIGEERTRLEGMKMGEPNQTIDMKRNNLAPTAKTARDNNLAPTI